MATEQISLQGKTLLISGASRGIGAAIARRVAADGANVALLSRTSEARDGVRGTVYTTAEEVAAAGGRALPVLFDVRDDAQVRSAIQKTVRAFGGIDLVVANAGDTRLLRTPKTQVEDFDALLETNLRGTWLLVTEALPLLQASDHPQVLALAPPPSLEEKWLKPHLAYTVSKMGVSLLIRGWAAELGRKGIGFSALWPRTAIATATVESIGGERMVSRARRPEIMGEAARAVLRRSPKEVSGRFFIDDLVLAEEGVQDFDRFALNPGGRLQPDFFLPQDLPKLEDVVKR
ncbi:MAG: SDR family oxidoreductase [Acidobacteriota bacterium]